MGRRLVGYYHTWARLADGRIASLLSRREPPGGPQAEPTAWWLERFTIDGFAAGGLVSAEPIRLGPTGLDQLIDIVPTRDGGLLMAGNVDTEDPRDPALAVRRILPDGSLDRTYGRRCGQPALRTDIRGVAAMRAGGALLTASSLVIHARPRSIAGWSGATELDVLLPGRCGSAGSAPVRRFSKAAVARF